MPQVITNYAQIKRLNSFDNGKLTGHIDSLRTVTLSGNVKPRDYIGSVLYGIDASFHINSSTDNGVTWTVLNSTIAPQGVTRIFLASDGELVIVTTSAIYRTSGWANPSTATLSSALVSTSDGGNTPLNEFSSDGNGTKFIAIEYGAGLANWPSSRKAWISTNSGVTWTEVYDAVDYWTEEVAELSHGHGCCYDPIADRFWLTEGHVNNLGALLFSDDDGATWNEMDTAKFPTNAAPTTIISSDDGIYLGTDNADNGIYFLARGSSVADQQSKSVSAIWKWIQPYNETWSAPDGLAGFANKMVIDPVTKILYTAWNSSGNGAPGILTASDTAGGTIILNVGSNGALFNVTAYGNAISANSSTQVYYGNAKKSSRIIDPSGILGGYSGTNSSYAVGSTASTGDAANSVAIAGIVDGVGLEKSIVVGVGATVESARSVSIGYASSCTGTDSVVIGNNATGAGTFTVGIGSGISASEDSVVIGYSSQAQLGGVAIGRSAVGTGAYAITIGASATSDASSIAVGFESTATGVFATAIGRLAVCTHFNSTAIGKSSTTSAENQTAFGQRHMELLEVTAPTNGGANTCRIYCEDNGAGKTRLMAIFQSGAAVQIALEP